MSAGSGSNILTRKLVLLFAIAGGTAVGNLYWAQPLLAFIADDLHASTAQAGWLVTATQVGYAVGIVLIVPLGDIVDRRRLILLTMSCATVALIACALAPSFAFLLVTIFLLGLTTVAGQLLTPLAGDLADDSNRGRVVGTVVSGILTGILVSRTISGLVADIAGWRMVYAAAAVVDIVLAVALYRALPVLRPKTSMRYPALIASVVAVVVRESSVRWTLLLGSLAFALFTLFWTALTFLLSGPPFSYSVSVIGLFGLAGLAGAIAAQRAGVLHDRGWSVPATGAAWALALIGIGIASLGSHSAALILVAVVLLDVAIQSMNILNQTRLFAVSHAERSRINTAFVTSNFMGGAAGSAVASLLWSVGAWRAVCLGGMAICTSALCVWALARNERLVPGAATTSGSEQACES